MLGPKDNRQTVFKFISDNPSLAEKLLHNAGCRCEKIDLSFAINQGPRCRNCNTIAFVMTDEFKEEHNLK